MRRFHNKRFPHQLADSLHNTHLTIPDQAARDTLDYIKQFLQRSTNYSILYRGYLTEEQLNNLLKIKAENDNKQFNETVYHFDSKEETSENVTEFDNFDLFKLEIDKRVIDKLDKIYYQVDSEEAKTNIRTIQSLSQTSLVSPLQIYLPEESIEQINLYLQTVGG